MAFTAARQKDGGGDVGPHPASKMATLACHVEARRRHELIWEGRLWVQFDGHVGDAAAAAAEEQPVRDVTLTAIDAIRPERRCEIVNRPERGGVNEKIQHSC